MVMDDFGYDADEQRRSRWMTIGALVAGAAVLTGAAFGVGRWTAPAAAGGGQRVTVSGPAGGPGPTRVENGVPVGYAHTQDGAVAAATTLTNVKDGQLITQPERYRSAIDVMAAPAARSTFQGLAEKEINSFQQVFGIVGYAQQGRTVVFRTVPLAYHLDKYDST